MNDFFLWFVLENGQVVSFNLICFQSHKSCTFGLYFEHSSARHSGLNQLVSKNELLLGVKYCSLF